jgi:hypothetical protein
MRLDRKKVIEGILLHSTLGRLLNDVCRAIPPFLLIRRCGLREGSLNFSDFSQLK